ncbi:acetyl-CoA carboxylase biotin carboxyl carrier protein subunit [Endomicrobiia bacterium]|nr:acetyl-CoA carboxylase biotin carboxyl carrier protein subunit [Endomicrobiia bacterium]GHT65884.1 acetyl-CoA carboxylase biotin carboxyl carrier protein subunit [Endomicrobiia bacterium]GHT71799.1 acetyl-CoA carboxylase biotin carboxyl carrier protein subunit [Endomicrobiia bacterium]GHT74758.1 acetyl-CoA carboxylase biotin carboxyl carrier protein subunit [Endomicrobiia bacterium]
MASDIKSKVKSLYEIMKEEKIQELEVNSKDYSVCIKRKDNNENKQVLTSKKQTIEQTTEVVEEGKDTLLLDKTIKSPITGVFYKSPSPSAPMFVNEGDVIEIGETLCIIEAMKVMNEIKATFKAKIVKILHENGKSVNLGQDLFEVEKV